MKERANPQIEKMLMNTAVITMTGRWEVCVENYRFLRLLSEQEIQIQARNCRVTICGKHLVVACYTKEFMKVRGLIESICCQP